MTDDFATQYTETFDKVVSPAAQQTKARVTAEVQGSAVIRATESTVRVLLFVDQNTISTANDGPQQSVNRVEMVMVKRGESWKVDEVTSY